MSEEASQILMQAPPGHFESVLQDILSLTPESSAAAAAEYHNDVTRAQFESFTGASIAKATANTATLQPFSSLLHDLLTSTGSTACQIEPLGVSTLLVSTYTEQKNVPNCHAASWFAQWNIQVSSSSSEAIISGSVIVKAYSHDDGNIQLHTKREFDETTVLLGSNTDTTMAEACADQISTFSKQVMEWLQQSLQEEITTTLKSLRRVLPITRTKMDWNVMTHRMVKILGDTKKR